MKVPLALVGALVLGIAIGRFTVPSRIVTKIEVQEKIVTVIEKVKSENVVTVYREVVKPDGTKVIKSRTFDKSVTQEKANVVAAKSVAETKTIERAAPDWLLRGVFSGAYGVGLDRRILGPLYLGGQALSDGSVSISIGLLF